MRRLGRDREQGRWFDPPAKSQQLRVTVAWLGCLIVVFAGCKRNPDTVPVTGKVLYNGQPLTFGSVTFQPARGQAARGEIHSDGTFELSTYRRGDGAVAGSHKVRVACYESQDPARPKGPGEQTLGRSLIPLKYTLLDQSGLTAKVTADTSEPIVFNLTGPTDAAKKP